MVAILQHLVGYFVTEVLLEGCQWLSLLLLLLLLHGAHLLLQLFQHVLHLPVLNIGVVVGLVHEVQEFVLALFVVLVVAG